jgi:hypothetical protein
MADRYWVGGTGTWNQTSHWSTASGGASGASAPTASDNAIFDVNSFSALGQIVTVAKAVGGPTSSTCKNLTITGVLYNPEFLLDASTPGNNPSSNVFLDIEGTLTINSACYWHGLSDVYTIGVSTTVYYPYVRIADSIVLNPNFTTVWSGYWIMRNTAASPATRTITGNGGAMIFDLGPGSYSGINLQIDCGTDVINIQDDIEFNQMEIIHGVVNTNNHTTKFQTCTTESTGELNLGSSDIYCYGFVVEGGATFDSGTSTIHFEDWFVFGLSFSGLVAEDQTFYDVECPEFDFDIGNRLSGTVTFRNLTVGVGDFAFENLFLLQDTFSVPEPLTMVITDTLTIHGKVNRRILVGNCLFRGMYFSPRVGYIDNSPVDTTIQAANIDLEYVDFYDVKATGAAAPFIGTDLGDGGGNDDITFVAQDLYWVGGSGLFFDANNWSLVSGGVGGAGIPACQDSAIFDDLSFTADDQEVFFWEIKTYNYYGSSSDEYAYIFGLPSIISVGDTRNAILVFWEDDPAFVGQIFDVRNIRFTCNDFSGGHTNIDFTYIRHPAFIIKYGSHNVEGEGLAYLWVDPGTGSVTLESDFESRIDGMYIDHSSGTLDFNGFNVTLGVINSGGAIVSQYETFAERTAKVLPAVGGLLVLGTGIVTLIDTGLYVDHPTFADFTGANIVLSGTGGDSYIDVWDYILTQSSSITLATVKIDIDSVGQLYCSITGTTFTALHGSTCLFDGVTTSDYTFTNFIANATNNDAIDLNGNGSTWNLIVASGLVIIYNCSLEDSHASGGATFYACNCVDAGGNTGWAFACNVLPAYSVSVITAMARVQEGLPTPKVIMGGKGGASGTTYSLFKKASTYTFGVWRSKVYSFDDPFNVTGIRIPLSAAIGSNMVVVPNLYFDNGSRSAVGTPINSSNYDNNQNYIFLSPDNFENNVHGEDNFWLELQFIGTSLISVLPPIDIDVETET